MRFVIQNRKTNSAWLCEILPKCAGSVNCARADSVTSNVYRAHFRFLYMLKETQFFIKSSPFRRVSIEANIRNMAMHSFFKIVERNFSSASESDNMSYFVI